MPKTKQKPPKKYIEDWVTLFSNFSKNKYHKIEKTHSPLFLPPLVNPPFTIVFR
jgi:hypothetical protein